MSRILLFGLGPLPLENPRRAYGGSNRTWHFASMLRQAGHELCLLCMRITNLDQPDHQLHIRRYEGMLCLEVDELVHIRDRAFMQAVVDQYRPDAIIGVNPICAWWATQLNTDAPLWADLHGYLVGEAQLESLLHSNDVTLVDRIHFQYDILRRADVFSCTSRPHVYTVVGELGVAGRLNAYTRGYSFVYEVPLAMPSHPFEHHQPRIRPALAGADDLVVLWSGTYNLWVDTATLVEGLVDAMQRNPRIVFVSTGGNMSGTDDTCFLRVRDGLLNSPVAARCHFAGWVPAADVPDYLLEADVGLSIDRPCYEAVIGARNRITTMMKAGLPVITTLATDISRIVRDIGCGYTIPMQDPQALAHALLHAAENRTELLRRGERAQRYFAEHFTYEVTIKPVLEWAASPSHAPDYGRATRAA